jgi:hypothetical protein
MVEIANFKPEYPGGADVAHISTTDAHVVEVQRLHDGRLNLIVHQRHANSDRWDDCSAILTPRDFAVLGSIATMGECICGAPVDGRWADKHTADCPRLTDTRR